MSEEVENGEEAQCTKARMRAQYRQITLRACLKFSRMHLLQQYFLRDMKEACIPSSASSRTSAKSYPREKSVLWSAVSSGRGFCNNADARVDFPDDGWPSNSICFEGVEREDETESNIEDHRSSGRASGVDGRELSIASTESFNFKNSRLFVVIRNCCRRLPVLRVLSYSHVAYSKWKRRHGRDPPSSKAPFSATIHHICSTRYPCMKHSSDHNPPFAHMLVTCMALVSSLQHSLHSNPGTINLRARRQ